MKNVLLNLQSSPLAKTVFWVACATILVIALSPVELVRIFNWWDKAQHGLAFFALACVGFFAYPKPRWRMAFGLLSFGIVIELLQYITGWRFAELSDVLADVAGISLATIVMWQLQNYLKN